jgi:REP element-mobilizing transposase RayT
LARAWHIVTVVDEKPRRRYRKHIRLPGYDYASPGYYFVTLVTAGRGLLFDDIPFRDAVVNSWLWLAERYPYVRLDYFVVMPNHLHGIIALRDDVARSDGSGSGGTGSGGSRGAHGNKPLGQIIGAFKTVSTKEINKIRSTPGAGVWQLNFYERVIRNEREFDAIRLYILDNPAKWAQDPHNPECGEGTEPLQGGSRAAATVR